MLALRGQLLCQVSFVWLFLPESDQSVHLVVINAARCPLSLGVSSLITDHRAFSFAVPAPLATQLLQEYIVIHSQTPQKIKMRASVLFAAPLVAAAYAQGSSTSATVSMDPIAAREPPR